MAGSKKRENSSVDLPLLSGFESEVHPGRGTPEDREEAHVMTGRSAAYPGEMRCRGSRR